MLRPIFSNIPSELIKQPNWVVWKGPKIPYCPAVPSSTASSIDPDTWDTFALAKATYEEGGFNGVGFVLCNDGIVGIDLDNCVVSGTPAPAAMEILDGLACSYIELSPSGNGLRAFGFADPIKGTRGKINGINIELYSTSRYLTVTGHQIKSGPLSFLSGLPDLSDAIRARPTEEVQKKTEDDSSHLLSSSVGASLDKFLPTTEGERNRRLFELARYLKGTMPTATKNDLRPIVQQWHRIALPVIGTKDFGTSWADFLRAFDKVEFPFGATLKQILDSLDLQAAMPESLKALGYGPNCNSLIRICRHLQTNAGNSAFFLSARQAGDLTGMHYVDAAKCFKALTADNVLELVTKGAGIKASRYRYIWHE